MANTAYKQARRVLAGKAMHITGYVPAATVQALDQIAARRGVSRHMITREAIEEYAVRHAEEEQA